MENRFGGFQMKLKHNAEERIGQGNHMDIYIKDDTHFHFLKREIFNSHKIEWQRYWVIGLNSQMYCACENSIAFFAYNHLVNGCQGFGKNWRTLASKGVKFFISYRSAWTLELCVTNSEAVYLSMENQ